MGLMQVPRQQLLLLMHYKTILACLPLLLLCWH
jgi:hypothetical protein